MASGSPGLVARIVRADAAAATVLVRLLVGGVFLSEGIQKFVYPDALGVGRFTKIGIPAPAVMAPFVGGVEAVCGLLHGPTVTGVAVQHRRS